MERVERHSARRFAFIKINRCLDSILSKFGLRLRLDLTYAGSYFLWERKRAYHFDPSRAAEDTRFLLRYIPQNARVLDLGSGPGRIETELAPYEKEIHAVDVSTVACSIGRKLNRHNANVYFHATNGTDLTGFGDGYFDAVFSLSTFIHISQEQAMRYLFEILRVLKPGGVALIEFQDLAEEMEQFVYNAVTFHESEYRLRYYTPEAIILMSQRAGFEIISIDRASERKGSLKAYIKKPLL